MYNSRLDLLTRRLDALFGRRAIVRGAALVAASISGVTGDDAVAKVRRRCRRNGARCQKKSKQCQARFCLRAPVGIKAGWTNANGDHDSFLFVPRHGNSTDDSPYIHYNCTPGNSDCETEYPFACVSQDAYGPGDEITTIHQFLPGTYEYWIELDSATPAGEVTVFVRDADAGKLVRSWTSPANLTLGQRGWHVFDIDGATRSLTSIDQLIANKLPEGAHDPVTWVCPS
jgi:hypothetical protein